MAEYETEYSRDPPLLGVHPLTLSEKVVKSGVPPEVGLTLILPPVAGLHKEQVFLVGFFQ